MTLRRILFVFALLTVSGVVVAAAPKRKRKPAAPLIDPQLAIKQFQIPAGATMDLFAAEPTLMNPVQFCFDEQGRIYVAETYRYRKDVYDIRDHMNMYSNDLACRTVEDREAMLRKFLGDKVDELTNASEQIRLLEDRTGSGKADYSTVYATGFNSIVNGLGAGVLALKGNVYYTDIPNLWEMRDTNHDGHADVRKSLSYGYGVHTSLTGHDLHGLALGPDGKIYYSIGDRGLHVKTQEGKWLDYPDMGSVLRCNPDGSELEVFAYGVRNPQKLAFDDYGDLFTGDNNADHGDAARLVYVVEHGDSGWRIGFQISQTTPLGMWNAEELWHTNFPGQAAYIVPPADYIAQGPAGITHYPGTGFPASLDDHFFLCDYKGSSANSGIHSFAVEQKGAGFTMVDHTHYLWHILATDVNFSPDGRLFVADWVAHWPVTNKGRLYRLYYPETVNNPEVLETKKLLAEGMAKRTPEELGKLLAQPDQRVRLQAQFELADRVVKVGEKIEADDISTASRKNCLNELLEVAQHGTNRFARIHALWGLGQIGHRSQYFADSLAPVLPLLNDSDAEIRAQTAKILGEACDQKAFSGLVQALGDANLRVRFFAALSLGKLGNPAAVQPLLAMLRENANRDPYLRHAGAMGLMETADKAALIAAGKDESAAARMGVLLAMRRLLMPEITMFLHDANPLVVVEAARAINDAPINPAMPELAALIDHPTTNEFLDWRVINANFRVGESENAVALAKYAADGDALTGMRVEALYALQTWTKPSPRDRITGLWRPLPDRDGSVAASALSPVIEKVLVGSPAPVQVAAVQAVRALSLTQAGPAVYELAVNSQTPAEVRVEALQALEEFHDPHLLDAAKAALSNSNETVRNEGNRLLANLDPAAAIGSLTTAMNHGDWKEQQGALAILSKLPGAGADDLIGHWLDKLRAGHAPKQIEFDILAAAQERNSDLIKEKLKQYRAAQPKNDEFAGFRETLYGGDAAAGKLIFTQNPQANCIACHKIEKKGGDVGPNLTGIIKRHDREYILESILFPNKKIAPGFDSVLIRLKNGDVKAGILKSETADELTINSSEEGVFSLEKVKKNDIASRQRGLSAMPEGFDKTLSKKDIRDLVEFLAESK
jgi:quinoprotein glucose dehydrogenase